MSASAAESNKELLIEILNQSVSEYETLCNYIENKISNPDTMVDINVYESILVNKPVYDDCSNETKLSARTKAILRVMSNQKELYDINKLLFEWTQHYDEMIGQTSLFLRFIEVHPADCFNYDRTIITMNRLLIQHKSNVDSLIKCLNTAM